MNKQVRLIRDSFDQVAEMPEAVVMLFYGRLFELDPSLRPLFPAEMRPQAKKLVDMLATVVDAAGNMESIDDQLVSLGKKHVKYGARPEHYAVINEALLWAIGQAMEYGLDNETRAAWKSMLDAISGRMLAGATQA